MVIAAVNAPATGVVGRSIEVTWTGRNDGEAATPDYWYDRVYLSQDDIFGSDDFLADFSHSGILNPGESYTGGGTLNLPSNVYGDYWLFVVTDAYSYVPEFPHEGNNVSAAQAITITGGWYDRVTVVNTDTSETILSRGVYYDPAVDGAVGPGSSRPRSTTYVLPDGPRGTGNLQVTVTADAENRLFEYNAAGTAETNKQHQYRVGGVSGPGGAGCFRSDSGKHGATPGTCLEH